MKRFTSSLIISLLILICFSSFSMVYSADNHVDTDIIERGRVLSLVRKVINPTDEYPFPGQILEVKITSGEFKGQVFEVYHMQSDNPSFDIQVEPGQRVILTLEMDENDQLKTVIISDLARDLPLTVLAIIFALVLILLGGLRGLKSLVSLAVTILLIFTILLPLILKGYDPIIVAIGLSALTTTITLILVSGWKRKTMAAILGIIGGTTCAGLLAFFFGKAARLTGLGSHEAQMLGFFRNYDLNFQGILFASMLFGALGAIMDVGMSIASAIDEVHYANPLATPRELFTSGMNVGRDIMGTMSNTLILAYVGGSLPLLLILLGYQPSFLKVINLDLIASEIIRALTGSLGLFVAIPLTAAISTWLIYRTTVKKYYN